MTRTVPTTRSDFTSGAQRCAAWLTLPTGPGPHPAVVLAHGLGATHEMMLPQYEQHFAAAGIATLAFDYLHTGASEGAPRQRFSIRRQCRDVHAALNHVRAHPAVDAGRIGLWGTSLGGMNAVRVAAERNDIAAAVVQCPIVHGPAAARSLGLPGTLRMAPAIGADALRALARRGRHYVPIVGPPGGKAMVTAPDAESGWNSTVPPGGSFDNRIAAADMTGVVIASALRHARRISAPLLVCVCDRENLMDPRYAALVAARAPLGVARHYDSDHFAIYHPPLVSRVLADQTAFLREHLGVRA
ncbi:alpha/beta hydrolase [Mycolicibacterium neworleansense]|uniref:Alpha/beta hydrolase n=1 Tax=Mycolicibacterium neworleansense TaxID=146018 RepID=A0A0H5RWY8_9MYCO|nr:alpha/beta hydrolase [Mycolicibacterium neworleansense]MCV7362457.1 alpha/beta fold hydrolase [Mycolicibacterium neworleansense]CRZ18047.1 alpha/beta hydrolase [Mycolicibacterium neworleansense]